MTTLPCKARSPWYLWVWQCDGNLPLGEISLGSEENLPGCKYAEDEGWHPDTQLMHHLVNNIYDTFTLC